MFTLADTDTDTDGVGVGFEQGRGVGVGICVGVGVGQCEHSIKRRLHVMSHHRFPYCLKYENDTWLAHDVYVHEQGRGLWSYWHS